VLDAFIIDELRRREVEERDDAGQPRVEIPSPDDEPERDNGGSEPRDKDKDGDKDEGDKKSDRGIVTIDL
jgi:hypothetical protein